MEAASGGYNDIVKLLMEHGADLNAQSSSGKNYRSSSELKMLKYFFPLRFTPLQNSSHLALLTFDNSQVIPLSTMPVAGVTRMWW